MAYGKQRVSPEKQKQKSIYPYGPAEGAGGEVANSGKKMRGVKLGKNLSRETNKGMR